MKKYLKRCYYYSRLKTFRLLLSLRFIVARLFFVLSSKADNSVILFGEKAGLEARDNAFTLFSSLFETGRRDIYFVAARKCKDKSKLDKFGSNVLRYNSFKHLIYIFRSRLLVINDGYRDVYPNIKGVLGVTDAPFMYLQHGILRYKRVHFTSGHYWGRILRFVISTNFEVDIMTDKMFSEENNKFRIELEYIRELLGEKKPILSKGDLISFAKILRAKAKLVSNPSFKQRLQSLAYRSECLVPRIGMPKARLVQSGLPRHDRLAALSPVQRTREIVIFFTWREKWIGGGENSPFVKRIIEIINNNQIKNLAKEYDLTFKVFLHHQQRNYAKHIKAKLPKNVTFNVTNDIATEMATCGAIISDYSSVVFDFCLAGAPVLFYHPDLIDYQSERGDFTDNESDWIGPIATTPVLLANHLRDHFEGRMQSEVHTKALLKSYPNYGNSVSMLSREVDNIPLRVVFVVYNIFGTGGTVKSVTTFANYLFENGYQVEIISLRRTKKVPDMGLHPSIRVYSLQDHTRPQTTFERLFRSFRTVLVHKDSDLYEQINLLMDVRLIKQLRQITSDVIVPTFPGLVPIVARYKRKNTKILAMEHQFYEAHKPTIKKLIEQHYPKVDGLTVLSDKDANDQSQFVKKVYKLPNGVDMPKGKLPAKTSKPRIIGLGRLARWKRFDLLISAFALLSDEFPDWELHIFGNGEVYFELEEQIKGLGLEKQVFLKGVTNNSAAELARSEICALPSEYEPFGMVIIEAYASRVPVVSFDVETGPREIVQHGITGFRAEALSIEDFANCLRVLMADNSLRKEMGEQAFELYKNNYSIQAAGERFEEIVKDVVE